MQNLLNQGCWSQGGRGATAPPPTFAKISPKFLQNRGFCLKFLPFAPHFGHCPPTCRQVPTALLIMGRFTSSLIPTTELHTTCLRGSMNSINFQKDISESIIFWGNNDLIAFFIRKLIRFFVLLESVKLSRRPCFA